MILVTCGTQKQPFTRFFDIITSINFNDEVIIQRGYNSINTKYRNYDFNSNFEQDYNHADIIITHGGVGSIMPGLLAGKKILVMPRLSQYGEHVDDHQLEITNLLAKQGYIYIFNTQEELESLLTNINKLVFKKYQSNNQVFNQELNTIIHHLFD